MSDGVETSGRSSVRAMVLTGSSLRHRYFASIMSDRLDVISILSEERKGYYTKQRSESAKVRKHFDRIGAAEERIFGEAQEYDFGGRWQEVENLNDPRWVELAKNSGAEVVLLYGTAILKDDWLEAFENRVINLHLGLSPFYRGSATLFWPFYHQELECLGTTIHLAVAAVDAGPILRRIKPEFRGGEDYYQITTGLIRQSIDRFPETAIGYLNGEIEPKSQEKVDGRLFRKADFTEEALEAVLSYVGDGLGDDEISRIEASGKCNC